MPDGRSCRSERTIAENSKKPMMPQRRVFRVGSRIRRVVGLRVRVIREAEVPPAFKQEEFASTYESRFKQTPAETNSNVVFEGVRGESLCTLKPPPDTYVTENLK